MDRLPENENGFELLKSEIIIKAVNDWKALSRGTKTETPTCNYKELRNFFMSDWSDFLLLGTDVCGENILKELEKYKREEESRRIKK